jgi:DNA polymerase-3 subunit gamma/tau
MYQVIARKYRPQAFDELISQEHVKTTIENAIAQGRIAHGYIFSGQRGTGKTTVARILARCLNCEQGPTARPCGKCASCMEISAGSAIDVIEIDAASNRGINEMRELRESVRFRPARDRYKVFIVDEAHQITSEAFNALLKTLEEPPEWVVFVLCTTESHKIPATIQSRCQQFSFRSVDFAELVARMEWIAKQEGIEADSEVLSVLAQAGEGSVRDSLSALDQAIACCGTKLTAGEVRTLLGMFSLDSLNRVAEALRDGDSRKMFDVVAELETNGRSLQHFARELARYFRNLLVVKIAGGATKLVAASHQEQQALLATAQAFSEEDLTRYLQLTLDLFRDLQVSLQPRLHLELGLLRLVHAGKLVSIEEALAGLGNPGNPMGAGHTSAPLAAVQQPSVTHAHAAQRGSKVTRTTAVPEPAPAKSPGVVARDREAAMLSDAASGEASETTGDYRSRLHAALVDKKLTHVADALEHSEVKESPNELVFTTPKMYQLFLKQPDFEEAAKRVAGRPVRVTVKVGEVARGGVAAGSATSTPLASSTSASGDDAVARAMAHPEVKRFQELFPDSAVRAVRNLKDT